MSYLYLKNNSKLALFVPKLGVNIVIEKVADKVRGDYLPIPKQLQGITFYTPCAEKNRIFIMSNEIADIQRNPRDYTGKESVSVPLTHLQYPLFE